MNRVKLLSFVSLFLLFITVTSSTFAHREGVPILKMNGQLVKIYFDRNFSDFVFDLPYDADKAPENYIVNQKIDFEIDVSKFPVPQELLEKSEIIWNYGDGTEEKGITKLSASHIYTKSGTFTIDIFADVRNAGFPEMEPEPLQTVIVNILPNKDYRLPEAVIKINDEVITGFNNPESTNSATESGRKASKTFKIDFNNKLTFDASNSNPGTAKIKSYRWSFGQGLEGKNKVESFRYKLPQFFVSAVLRVEDENGYFSETFVNLENSGLNEENNPALEETLKFIGIIGGASLVTFLLFLLGFWLYNHRRKKAHH